MRRIFEPPAPHLIEFGWNHGRYLDLWSLVHLSTGALLGMAAWSLGWPFTQVIFVVAVLAAFYEVAEIILQVSEDVQNVICDIVVTTLGGALAWWLLTATQADLITLLWAFAIIAVVDLCLFSLGWQHYLKKKLYGN